MNIIFKELKTLLEESQAKGDSLSEVYDLFAGFLLSNSITIAGITHGALKGESGIGYRCSGDYLN
jgi:hypothetical protein